jgi:hypothetical protein
LLGKLLGNPYADVARATGTTTLASEVQLRVMESGQSAVMVNG